MVRISHKSSILYIANGRSFYSSTPGRKLYSVVKCFRDSGHDVTFVCGGDLLSQPQASAKARTYVRMSVSKGKPYGFLVHSISEARDILHDRRLFRYLLRVAQEKDIHLIWERSSRLHWAGLRLARKFSLPYVMEWKDNLVYYGSSIFRSLALSVERKKLAYANHIIVESSMLARQISKDENIPLKKVIVAVNAVDAEEFYDPPARERMRDKYSIRDDQFVVGYVGSFASYHNLGLLCEVVSELKKTHSPADIVFALVGDGTGRPEFEKEVKEHGMEEWFRFMEQAPKEEVPKYLSMFDCAILPDSTEIICPIKVLEYMAAELPVLIPDYEANREVVTSGQDGILFEPKNPKAIYRNIVELMRAPERSRCLGMRARRKVIHDYSWENTWGSALTEVLREQ